MLRFTSDNDIAKLLTKVELKTFEAGDIIFEEGDPADDLYVIHQGFIKISKRDETKQRILSYLSEGDCFGETGVLANAPRSASATAMSRTNYWLCPAHNFNCSLMPIHKRFKKVVESQTCVAWTPTWHRT